MKNIRIGIFGLGRGGDMISNILLCNGEIVALCDGDEEKLAKGLKASGGTAATYTSFDKFLEHPMDAVLLCNYFPQHAPYAIRCLEKGISVLSECTAASTMAECVALVRAAEKSRATYCLLENYPHMTFNREIKRVCDGGTLGKILFAEGEYNHPFDPNDVPYLRYLRPDLNHWRSRLPRSYYITHALAPLMYMTGATPRRVCAFASFAPPTGEEFATYIGDRAAIITCFNDDESVFRVTGCAAFGAHENSYRVCGTNGQIENIRGFGNKVLLRYNKWQTPEGMSSTNLYEAEGHDKDEALAKKAAHGGGDFFVIRNFFDCLRGEKDPDFNVYAATTMSAVAILANRSILAGGQAFEVPDFRREADRVKYENDTLTPFFGADGSAPTVPCCSHPDYKPTDEQIEIYDRVITHGPKE